MIGFCRILRCTPEYVLHGISYANLVLYSAAMPRLGINTENQWDSKLDACDPNNFKNYNNKEVYI